MSNAIFPTFPGLAWSVYKTPEWSTSAQRAVSGKEIRMANRARPVWLFSLSYEILRGASVLQEYQKLLAFYNARQGSFDSFLFNDTSDNTATAQVIGTGDGVRTSWPLTHQIDTWSEPVGYAPSPTMYVNGSALYGVSRTNLQINSDNFSNWNQSLNTTVSANVVAAPDGSTTADAINMSATGAGVFSSVLGLTVGSPYCMSVYLRADTPGTIVLQGSYTTAGSTRLNVTTTWQRFAVPYTPANPGDNPQICRVGSGDLSKVYAWGAQLESGSVATAYIPTASTPVTIPGDFTCADGVNVTFSTPPPAGSTITWSGTFYYRMRFDRDTMEFEQFMRDFWALKKCDLRGVI